MCTSQPAANALLSQLKEFDFAFVVADATKRDMPITFASSSFYEMTGYGPDEVLGRNCRFLQGPETERRKIMEIRDAVREDRSCQVCLLNYRKDGSKFWNQFHLSPVCDDQGHVVQYIGIQTDVTNIVEGGGDAQQTAAALANAVPAAVAAASPEPSSSSAFTAAALSPVGPSPDEDDEARRDEVPAVLHQEELAASRLRSTLRSGLCSSSSCLHSSLLQPLMRIQQSFVLADPGLPDMPIVHVSELFLELTGYAREEVVGRNCRFLQGPGTNPDDVAKLRAAITATPPVPVTVTLLNYHKSGKPFWNALHVAPVRNAEGQVLYFVGVQLDITAAGADEALLSAASAEHISPLPVGMTQRMAHKGVTGAVRVAVRSLGGEVGLRRSLDCHGLPKRGCSRDLPTPGGCSGRLSSGSSAGVRADGPRRHSVDCRSPTTPPSS